MGKLKNKLDGIINWYDGLDSLKKLVVSIIIVLILFILVELISKINFNKKIVDYKTLSLENVKANFKLTNDKDIYMKSDEIIKNLLMTSINRYEINGKKVSLKDYSKYALYSEYNITNYKFKKMVNNISNDVFNGMDINSLEWNDVYPLIKNIYVYSDEYKMYLIELDTVVPHSIGIKYTAENTFYIFYLE